MASGPSVLGRGWAYATVGYALFGPKVMRLGSVPTYGASSFSISA